jgi:hypothetical protein
MGSAKSQFTEENSWRDSELGLDRRIIGGDELKGAKMATRAEEKINREVFRNY